MIFLALLAQASLGADYDRIIIKLNQLHQKHPSETKIFELGENDQGETIKGIEISTSSRPVKTNQLVVATHHGNERLSTDSALRFAEMLLADIKNPNSKYPQLKKYRFYVIPVLNISGYNSNRRGELDHRGRVHDPNRDYPDPCAGNSHYKLRSTSQLAEFVAEKDIVGAVTIHGYIGTFTFPWGIYTDAPRTSDHEIYHRVARNSVTHNGYRVGTHTEVIYPTQGAFEDWAYHKHGVWTMLLELKRRANLTKDGETLLSYFNQIPDIRSQKHEHRGKCTKVKPEEVLSRP